MLSFRPGVTPDRNDSDRELLTVFPALVRALLVSSSKEHHEE